MDKQIHFCTTSDGVRIAYATAGAGPELVCPPGWISDLEGVNPDFDAFIAALAKHHTVVWYDKHGCGLSDRERSEFTLESELRPLAAVVDHLKLKRFILFGISQDGPASIAYAARYPRRVSQLILYGTVARGTAVASDDFRRSFIDIVRSAWGIGSKALSDMFLPGADVETIRRFARMQRSACSAEMAASLLQLTYDVDISDLLPRLRAPTLVIHRRGDRAQPFRLGREMAALIPKARFVPLEGNLHPPFLGDVDSILNAIAEFLGDPTEDAIVPAAAQTESGSAPSDAAKAVMISYAHEDVQSARAVCTALEASGMPCWIAPRDVRPGSQYAEAIVDAIDRCRLMVVIVSEHANASPHVSREVEHAASSGKAILPLRIEDVSPSKALGYFLSTAHRLDAFAPLERHLERVTATARELLDSTETDPAAPRVSV
jgi:pimeloyl-ACP methyl ester carboxylesterase